MTTTKRNPDQRYRDRCFPGADKEVFVTKGGGFAPLPLISRELLRHLKGAELRIWVYLLTRGGPQSICYPAYENIMREAGVTKGTITKALHRLEKIGLIRTYSDKGTRRYLLRDPRLAVERLYELGEITKDDLEDANDLLHKIHRPLIEARPKVTVPVPINKKMA